MNKIALKKILIWDRNLLCIFLLSFASGIPFLLILSTLSLWLTEVGANKTKIGLFAWVTIAYSLKFLWSPLVDQLKIPVICKFLGLRKGWIFTSQILLVIAICFLATSNPEINLLFTALWAVLVGVFSATQDLVIEAYRIEILTKDKLGLGAAISVLGYRLGMLCSGAGAIYLAEYFHNWQTSYQLMAAVMLIGIMATLLASEPKIHRNSITSLNRTNWFTELVIKPIKSFMRLRKWWIIIPFIISFKLADTILNSMSMPFLIDIGFNKLDIANVAKTFGITFMILGGIFGGFLLHRQTLKTNLIICVVLQIIACLLFYQQAILGNNLSFLFVSMGVENFTCGMSQVALICYLSKLCSLPNTAMHYAILSSFASFVRINFSTLAGMVADHCSWPVFYLIITLMCLPTLYILIAHGKHFIRFSYAD